MNIDEIRGALNYRDGHRMRESFAAMIAGDGMIEGVSDGPDEAQHLLLQLADMLQGDPTPLPPGLAPVILGQAAAASQIATFGDAASLVRADFARWQALLTMRFPALPMGE